MSFTKKYIKSKKVFKVTFTVPRDRAFGSAEILLLGDFNNWDYDGAEMKSLKNGSFSKTLQLDPGRTYQFRYRTKEGQWFNDEAADAYWGTDFFGTDNSVVDLTKVVLESAAKKSTPSKKESKKAVAKSSAKKSRKASGKSVAKKHSSNGVKASKKNGKDKLSKIEGIGPKIEGILWSKGITSFDQLASSKTQQLKEILVEAGPQYGRHQPTTWPKQAKYAAEGKWEELSRLQSKLNGGR